MILSTLTTLGGLETALRIMPIAGNTQTNHLLSLATFVNHAGQECTDCFNVECKQRSELPKNHLSKIRARMDSDERETYLFPVLYT